jgi:hypothetical protein
MGAATGNKFGDTWFCKSGVVRPTEGSMDDWSSVKLCDVVNLILGMVLFFSPWTFDLSAGAQWQTASVI